METSRTSYGGVVWAVMLLTVGFCISACVERVLQPVGAVDETDSGSAEPQTDSTSSSDSASIDDIDTDTATLIELPISVTYEGDSEIAIVSTAFRDERVQTSWYSFYDSISTVAIDIPSENVICAEGVVAEVVDSWTFAGIGLAPCFTGANESPAYTLVPLGTCPITDQLDTRLLGVRFRIEGNAENPPIYLHLREPDKNNPSYFLIESEGAKEYRFKDALTPTGQEPLQLPDLVAVQFQVEGTDAAFVPFRFCIYDMTFLIMP